MKEIDINHGEYSSRHGLTDLYPESEAKLREALVSGEDFTTGWTGCKKESRYVKYTREGDKITIALSAHMDALWEADDLIYDALWAACKVEEELSDEFINSVRESLGDDTDIDDHTDITIVVPSFVTFERIMELTGTFEEEAERNNQRMFDSLCDIVKEHWLRMKGMDRNEIETGDEGPSEGPVLKM